MSLFDLQDVCIAIGSLATLDLPMVVDLIGIYVLKGPYFGRPLSSRPLSRPRRRPAVAYVDRTCSDQLDEEFPSVMNSSVLLVQADECVLNSVMDLIDDLPPPTEVGFGSATVPQQWYQSQGSDPSMHLVPYCIRSQNFDHENKKKYFGLPAAAACGGANRASSRAMAAHDARPMSPGLALMAARWSKRSARLCAAIGAAVRHASRGDARPSCNLVARPAALGAGSVMAAAAVRRDSRQIVATADVSF
ncbi:L-type lectin-domain containing receptor kinase IX.1-like [Dorcoceras hygrometricum]|uniref:L-type lectin-domain containing receptor kinase IX.1-like n=1 Tax=Dorcoceras hygrometricum TaxID=472368 RepID=A0A2Z7B9H2_9LAMI|nr:L-type lectin-domain containing receptor kinase IX.1-like [Dorcoceras hygrometricum]